MVQRVAVYSTLPFICRGGRFDWPHDGPERLFRACKVWKRFRVGKNFQATQDGFARFADALFAKRYKVIWHPSILR